MIDKDEFLSMLGDEHGDQTGWMDSEVDEFLQVMEGDGWVVIRG